LLETAKLNRKFYKFFKDHKKDIKNSIKDLRIIYTDLDGTLFNDQGCAIKDAEDRYYFDAVGLLPAIKQKGIDLVLVSGRDKYQLRYNAQMIGAKNYISELGSELIYDLGKTVRVTFDDKKYVYDLTYGGKDVIEIIELLMGEFPGRIETIYIRKVRSKSYIDKKENIYNKLQKVKTSYLEIRDTSEAAHHASRNGYTSSDILSRV